MTSTAEASMIVRDPSGIWSLLNARLQQYMPLAKLSFKDGTGSSKIIQNLDLKPVTEGASSCSPMLSMLLFRCEDLEAFRRQRVLVDGFVADDNVRKQSFIILLVALGGGTSDQTFVSVPGRSLARSRPSRKAFERLENEFGTSTYEEIGGFCALIELFESGEEADRKQWEALITKIGWCVSWTAEKRSASFEALLRQRMKTITPENWDFPQFFLLKESYSNFYEQLHLLDEALRQYDELDAIQSYIGQSMKPAFAESLEQCAMVLDSDGEKFRASVLQGKAGDLDFYKHIFARQCQLLLLLNRPDDVASRALPFIRQFSNAMDRSPAAFSSESRCGWIIAATTAIVRCCEKECDQILIDPRVGPHIAQRVKSLLCRCGEVMAFGLDRIEKLGIESGLLNFNLSEVAFATYDVVEEDADTSLSVSAGDHSINEDFQMSDIKATFLSKTKFESLCVGLSKMVEKFFRRAGRTRFATRVMQRLALIHLRQGRVRSALRLFEEELQAYESGSWRHLQLLSLLMSARCLFLYENYVFSFHSTNLHFRRLGNFYAFAERSFSVLSIDSEKFGQRSIVDKFQKFFVESVSSPDFPLAQLHLRSFGSLMQCRASQNPDIALSYRLSFYKCNGFVGQRVEMELIFHSIMTSDFLVDSVEASFRSSHHQDALICMAKDVVVHPGKNVIAVVCATAVIAGLFELSSLHFFIGRVMLEQQFENDNQDECAFVEPALLIVAERKSSVALGIHFAQPNMVLGQVHRINIEVWSQCDVISRGLLKLQSDSQLTVIENSQVPVTVCSVDGENEHVVLESLSELRKGMIELPPCESDCVIRFSVSVSPPENSGPHHELDIQLRYQEASDADDCFEMVSKSSVDLQFKDPLSLTSSIDCFGGRTFVTALVHCSADITVSVISYVLDLPSSYAIVLDPNLSLQRPLIPPNHSYSLVFELERVGAKDADQNVDTADQYAPFLDEISSVGTLRVRCRPGTDGSIVHLDWAIPLSQEQHGHSYQVTVTSPLKAETGQLIPFSVSIVWKGPASGGPFFLLYELQVDHKSWMLSGTLQGRLRLGSNCDTNSENVAEVHLHCKLLAVGVGHLALPKLRLSELPSSSSGCASVVDADRISSQYSATQVLVYPSTTCVSAVSLLP